MDLLHSKLWDLVTKDFSIKDATQALQLKAVNINPIFYIRESTDNSVKDPFWKKIEARIELLKDNHRNSYESLLLYTLALLYVDLPTRRNKEFQTMLLDPSGRDENQYLNTFDGEYFSFRSFKSVMRDKHTHLHLDKCTPRLREALELYLQNHPCLPFESKNEVADFICDKDGNGYTKINSFTRLLQKALGTSCQELRRKWFSRFT